MPSGKIYTFDPKINFDITDKKPELKQFSADNFLEFAPLRKVDYGITENIGENNLDKELEKTGEYIKDLMSKVKTQEEIEKNCANFEKDVNDKRQSLSFLNVKDEKEGALWYKQQFPKLPEEFAEIMGRWNWGDLSQMTKKTSKNDKKKIAKGHKKTKEKYEFQKKEGNFVITFD